MPSQTDDDEPSSSHNNNNNGNLTPQQAQQLVHDGRRSKVWLVGILLVVGSCLLAIIHLSNGLHSQLVGNRRMVKALKEQLLAEGEEREALSRDKDVSMTKTQTLRAKSKLVTEELLDQQRKSSRLSQELKLAREDLALSSRNCTLSNLRMKNRFEVALRELHDRLVAGEACRALLARDVDERAKLESSLVLTQDRAYNASKLLKQTKHKLREVLQIASSQRDEIAKLKQELAAKTGGGGGGGWFSSSSSGSAAAAAAGATSATAGAASTPDKHASSSSSSNGDWKQYTDKTTGKRYWYNVATKKTQWDEPKPVVAAASSAAGAEEGQQDEDEEEAADT